MTRVGDALAAWVPYCARMDLDAFVAASPSFKRAIYESAKEEYLRRGFRRGDSVVKSFVKFEKLNFTVKKDPVPRVIQPRTPLYNLLVGSWIRPLEPKVYKALEQLWNGPAVMKGLNACGVAQEIASAWFGFADPVAITADAVRFDQHVSSEALRWEHSVYCRVFPDQEFAALLRMQLVNKGRCYTDTHKIKYEVDGCRMSGDMNTGLGNCLLMCALVYQFCVECGMAVAGSRHERDRHDMPRVHARIINNGDDFTLITERRFLRAVQGRMHAWFLDFGFNLEVEEPVYELEQIEFCQAHPVWCADGWRMVRNLDALTKDTLCLRIGNEAEMWMAAVGNCGHALAGCVPIYNSYYKIYRTVQARLLRRFVAFEDMGMYRMARGMNGDLPVTDACRASFYAAFGITPEDQLSLEAQYGSTARSGQDGPAFDRRTRTARLQL